MILDLCWYQIFLFTGCLTRVFLRGTKRETRNAKRRKREWERERRMALSLSFFMNNAFLPWNLCASFHELLAILSVCKVAARERSTAWTKTCKYGNPIKIWLKWRKFLCNITNRFFAYGNRFSETEETMNPFPNILHTHTHYQRPIYTYIFAETFKTIGWNLLSEKFQNDGSAAREGKTRKKKKIIIITCNEMKRTY